MLTVEAYINWPRYVKFQLVELTPILSLYTQVTCVLALRNSQYGCMCQTARRSTCTIAMYYTGIQCCTPLCAYYNYCVHVYTDASLLLTLITVTMLFFDATKMSRKLQQEQ
jgi:hypothetical protein